MYYYKCALVLVCLSVAAATEEEETRQERRYEEADSDDVESTNNIHFYGIYDEDDYGGDDDSSDDDDAATQDNSKGLVPQLWANYTGPSLPPAEEVDCAQARIKCAYRAGCGLALQNYALACRELAAGNTTHCNTHCRHSLIALMSTLEGQRLMKCNCSGSSFCETSKTNVAGCAGEVLPATHADTVVSCTAAQWICAADPLCSTALEYYNRFCGAMFRGRRCTKRCLNSIQILQRQKSSSKLESCRCDGTEPYECDAIKSNMDRLCFNKGDGIDDNEIDDPGRVKAGAAVKTVSAALIYLCLLIAAAVSALWPTADEGGGAT